MPNLSFIFTLLCLILGAWWSNKMHQKENYQNYQDFLEWGGEGGEGGGFVFRSFSYNNYMNLRVLFPKICNLTPPPLILGTREYSKISELQKSF